MPSQCEHVFTLTARVLDAQPEARVLSVRLTDLCFSCEGPLSAPNRFARPRPRDVLAVYHGVAGPRTLSSA